MVLPADPGEANHVAVALDRLAWPEVIGTLAGDDTIFIAVKDLRSLRRIVREIRRLALREEPGAAYIKKERRTQFIA